MRRARSLATVAASPLAGGREGVTAPDRTRSLAPLLDEADQAERFARFLRHARGGRTKGRTAPLTWEDAELALFAHARTLRALRAKLERRGAA